MPREGKPGGGTRPAAARVCGRIPDSHLTGGRGRHQPFTGFSRAPTQRRRDIARVMAPGGNRQGRCCSEAIPVHGSARGTGRHRGHDRADGQRERPSASNCEARAAALGRRAAPVRPGLVRRRSIPRSALARSCGSGVDFTNAQTPFPSDSFPGMVAQVTGGNPTTTGVYYDDTLQPRAAAGRARRAAPASTPGAEVTYFEQLDKNPHALDAGQGLAGLPDGILAMTGNPATADRPGAAAGRSGDLQAGLPAPLPEGQHDLRGRARGRPAHRVVGQAPRLRDPQRAVRHRRSRTCSRPRSTATRRRPARRTTGRRTTR